MVSTSCSLKTFPPHPPPPQTLLEEPIGAAGDRAACDALLARAAEAAAGEAGVGAYPPRGRAAAAARVAALAAAARASAAAPGSVRGLCFVDADALAWSVADAATRGSARTTRRGSAAAAAGGGGGAATAPPPLGPAAGALLLLDGGGGGGGRPPGARWLVAACDTKVLARDLSGEGGGAGWEVPRSALDSRAPTCLALMARFVAPGGGGESDCGPSAPPAAEGGAPPFAPTTLPLAPTLAVGTASGSVFLLSPDSGAVLARLGGAHKGAVTCVLALPSPDGCAGDILITGAADGSVAFWQPSAAAAAAATVLVGAVAAAGGNEAATASLVAGGAGGLPELPAAAVIQAHAGGVVAAVLACVPDPPPKSAAGNPGAAAARPGAPPTPALRLATAGADGTVALWEVGGAGRQLARARPLPPPPPGAAGTGPAGGLAPGGLIACRGGSSPGGADCLLLISGDAPGVWAWPARAWEAAGAVASPLAFPGGGGGGAAAGRGARRPPDLRACLPSGSKRLPKLYALASHPLRGDVAAVGGNAGVLLLRGGGGGGPGAAAPTTVEAAAPAPAPPLARVPPGRGRGGCAFLAASRGRLWGVEYRAGWREEAGGANGNAPATGTTAAARISARPATSMTADLASRGIVGDLPDHPGPCRVLASACGGWVAVLWPGAGRFAAFERPPDERAAAPPGGGGPPPPAPPVGARPWIPAASGTALDLAWATASPRLAVLTPAAAPAGGGGDEGGQGGRRRPSRGGGGAPPPQPAPPPSVDLVDFAPSSSADDCGGATLVATGVGPPGPPAVRLHGGGMLGVVVAGGGLHLLPWADPAAGAPTAPSFPGPAPAWVGWAPAGAGLALAAADGVQLLARRAAGGGGGGGGEGGPSTLTPFARPAIRGVSAGAWDAQHLTLLSPAAVHVCFIAGLGGRGTPTVEVLCAAALSPGPSAFPPPPAGGAYLAFPPPSVRPPGALTLAGASDGALWVVDTALRPTPLPLASHAGARARGLAAAGDTDGAAAVAARGLARHAHGDAAAFFAAAAGGPGAAAGAELAGLAPRGRAALARAAGRLAAAVRDLEEAAGGTPPPPRPPSPTPAALPLAGGGGGESLPRPSSVAPAAPPAAYSTDSGGDSAPLPPAIEWGAPLAAALAAGRAAGGRKQGAAPPAPALLTAAAASPAAAAAVVTDALSLAGAAWAAGEAETAARALGVALAAAPCLPPGPLVAVLVRAARAGRAPDAVSALAALATIRDAGWGGEGAAGPAVGVAALAAALAGGSVGGNNPSVPALLASAGLVSEAALWATTWRDGAAPACVAAWADAIAAACGGGVARVLSVE